MPSFLVHSIAGREIIKKLNLSNEEENQFFIANLLPDTRQIEIDDSWDEIELRRNVQNGKKMTHFRGESQGILEYPDLDFFLKKYGSSIKNDLIVYGYFFHLYTDYYYFHTFLPRVITFLDKDYNETNIKVEHLYIKVKQDGKIIDKLDFWSRKDKKGLYQEYSRINKYLIDKYNFTYDYDKYIDYLNNKKLSVKIEEIKLDKIYDLLEELNGYYEEAKDSNLEEFLIFSREDIDNLIQETIDSFFEKYGNLFDSKD